MHRNDPVKHYASLLCITIACINADKEALLAEGRVDVTVYTATISPSAPLLFISPPFTNLPPARLCVISSHGRRSQFTTGVVSDLTAIVYAVLRRPK